MVSRSHDYVLSHEGPGALLLDAAESTFSDAVQEKVWRVAADLSRFSGVLETVPGMNNLMVVFDPLVADDMALSQAIRGLWEEADLQLPPGRIVDVPVIYGGEDGIDLADFALAKAMPVEEIIRRHTAPLYSVAAVGAMPGFVYLSGLDPVLAAPRLANPRNGVPKGSVIIGGTQAGIMPVTAPSGWHILGRTSLDLFDPHRARPAYFKPGDRIRFVPELSQ
ncbi:5-oxoprolinase subunit PxpB [Rhizobium sp. KVB221]|uniref:5-oxoprolinase subunit PxpB n=1 Tax=Rhizobium setariae TaxID=2801340 RepID=A0A936YLI7_9HYPH|nr:5-oxoprolinase subunit PxpB [Rhizobium setariae]MBL0372674.1 5-oxoprolinase subunit PxpB [Rhizobium setariae]